MSKTKIGKFEDQSTLNQNSLWYFYLCLRKGCKGEAVKMESLSAHTAGSGRDTPVNSISRCNSKV